MNNNLSNNLLFNIPFRYDLSNSYAVNKKISTLNKKLQKLVRVFPHTRFLGSNNDRKLFTKHGLHRNKLGKILLPFNSLVIFNTKLHPLSLLDGMNLLMRPNHFLIKIKLKHLTGTLAVIRKRQSLDLMIFYGQPRQYPS